MRKGRAHEWLDCVREDICQARGPVHVLRHAALRAPGTHRNAGARPNPSGAGGRTGVPRRSCSRAQIGSPASSEIAKEPSSRESAGNAK